MRRILLKIRYDGSNYHGWQVQKNAVSVQQTLQDAIESVFSARLDIHGCSRTDSGVHANEYYCHFDTDKDIACNNITRALNTYLPHDIAVLSAEEVSSDFHARYNAKGKEYIYKFYNSPIRDPFLAKYALQIFKPMDVDRMNRVAQKFIGTYDFSGFCSIKSDVEDTVREITNAFVKKDGDLIIFSIEGNGFLYNMVRIIAGTIVFVENGNIKEEDIEEIILSKDRKRAGKTLPPHGLYLNKVIY